MSGGLEGIERLINEADQKFLDKLRLCHGANPPNLAVLADRTFNLRQQVAHNATLMGDGHFIEMLEDVELCLAPEYTLKGDLDRKLSAFLAGLLKGLLRDIVAVQSFAARKVQIEMTWHWHQDKKKQVLEFALDKLRPATAPKMLDGESPSGGYEGLNKSQPHSTDGVRPDTSAAVALVESSSSPTRAPTAPSKASAAASAKLRRAASTNNRGAGTARAGASSDARLTFADEAQRNTDQAVIAKKLAVYKKRNLSKSALLRDEVRAATADTGCTRGDAIRVVYTKRSVEKKERGDAALDPNAMQLCGTAGSGPSPYRYVKNTSAPVFNPPSSLATRPPETTAQVLATVNQRIVHHQIQRLEDEHDARDMRDAHHSLAFQQARLEEETARRVESENLAGQAGRTCHKMLRRLPRTGHGEEPVTAASQLPSAKMDRGEALSKLGHTVAPAATNEESLSAFDHYVPSSIDERRLKDLLTRLGSKDDEQKPVDARKRFGLTSPHPASMAGTGLNASGGLDVVAGPGTATTPIAPRTDVPIAELLGPILDVEEDVPSAARLEQLRLVERVRDCFARATTKGGAPMHVPRSVIERALVTPDDRPYEDCMRLLPVPGMGFPSNPNADAGKDKKGKKGKGKAKK